jgi:hypothetical protein
MQKVRFALFLTATIGFIYAKSCNYPYAFMFNTENLFPIMTTSIQVNDKEYKELMLMDKNDKYITITDSMPAVLTVKHNEKELFQSVLSNKKLDYYKYLNEYKKDNFLIKLYTHKDSEYTLFVFDQYNKFIGTVIIEAESVKLLEQVIKTLKPNRQKCTKQEYLSEFKKQFKKEVNKKLALLYSLILIEKDKKELKQLAKEAKTILDMRKTIFVDLPNANLDSLK